MKKKIKYKYTLGSIIMGTLSCLIASLILMVPLLNIWYMWAFIEDFRKKQPVDFAYFFLFKKEVKQK